MFLRFRIRFALIVNQEQRRHLAVHAVEPGAGAGVLADALALVRAGDLDRPQIVAA